MKYLLLLFFPLSLFSQQEQRENPTSALSVNFGSGSMVFIDYERLWYKGNTGLLLTSLGPGLGKEGDVTQPFSQEVEPDWYLTLPVKFSYCFGRKHHFLETGIGALVVFGNTSEQELLFSTLGYRFIGANQTTFKIYAAYPLQGLKTEDLAFIPFGFGLGQFF